MKRYFVKTIFLFCMCLVCPSSAFAEVDWQILHTINMEKKPVDVVMSARGTYTFILTDDGIVHVYDSEGNLKGQIDVGKNVDSLACGPQENLLILKSKKDKEIRTIIVDIIQDINIAGSPYKGNIHAPVVIVDFTDYQ